jgi:DNA modification methylase
MTKQLEIFPQVDCQVDWSFPQSSSKRSIHSIHPYPAKFIPEIPRELIKLYAPPKGTCILDPFCGSGTTLVEAQSSGYESIGIDLNPIACLISRVKTRCAPLNIIGKAKNVLLEANKVDASDVVGIPNVDHWFKESVKRRIHQIKECIFRIDEDYQDIFFLALSSIIVRVSNQDSDTRYAAVEKKVDQESVDAYFLTAVARLANLLPSVLEDKRPLASVIEKNILSVHASEVSKKVGLVITSPPYPNAYEYWLYHKYRMYWLGKNPLQVKKDEIGARAHYFKKNHATIEDFRLQMTSVFELLRQVCIAGAKVCFVVGRSKIHKRLYDNAELVREVAEQVGFSHVETFSREIKSQRKSFNLSHAEIKKESIVVVERDGQ